MMERERCPPRCRPRSRRPRATSRRAWSPRCRAPGRGRRRPRPPVGRAARRPAEGEPWQARVDLRVEDHADPLGELDRLVALQRAYELAGAGRRAAGRRAATRRPASSTAARAELAPGSDELLFWAGLAAAHTGELDERRRRRCAAPPRSSRAGCMLLDRLSPDFAPAARGGSARAGPVAAAAPAHERSARQPARRAAPPVGRPRAARGCAARTGRGAGRRAPRVARVALDVQCVRVRSPVKRSPPPRLRAGALEQDVAAASPGTGRAGSEQRLAVRRPTARRAGRLEHGRREVHVGGELVARPRPRGTPGPRISSGTRIDAS